MKRWVWLIALLLLLCACVPQTEPTDELPTPEPTAVPPEEETVYIPTPVPQVAFDVPAPTEDLSAATPEPVPPLKGIVIGIDPGHQQEADHDTEPIAPDASETAERCSSGTRGISSNVYEYQVNLSVALKLKALLEAKGARVILTRSTNDVRISSRERAELFNSGEVDLAICLHCSGADDAGVSGAYMTVPAKTRTETFTENVQAATAIIDRYCAVTGLSVRKNKSVVYRTDLTCFNWCTRPIICLEMGYLSNEKEDMLLTNDTFQDKMAFGILDGILAYFRSDANEEGGNG